MSSDFVLHIDGVIKIDNIELIKLYDIYGRLLTDKQRATFELYYLDDLSLREIAENNKISFQAVRDSIEVSKKQLSHFEEVVKMKQCREEIEKACELCGKENINTNKILKILDNLK